jgi:hypothetical protein
MFGEELPEFELSVYVIGDVARQPAPETVHWLAYGGLTIILTTGPREPPG